MHLQLAGDDGVSLNSVIVASVNNEVIRQETRDFFRDAAANYQPQAFAEALAAVADAPIEETDLIGDAEETPD